jgi:hypothetical protein
MGASSWADGPGDETITPTGLTMPAFCFAPGTSGVAMEMAYERAASYYEGNSLAAGSILNMQLTSRWSATATNGSVPSEGTPITLTWRVVADGTPIGSGYGEPAAASNLRTYLNEIYGSINNWLPIFQQVFDRWSELTGVTYVYEPNDDGSQLAGYAGQLGVRADIRIGGHYIDGDLNVLAYNYYPSDGDMVIDTGDSYFENTSPNSLRLRNTLAHEHGHGLGLLHVCPVNQTKLMEPTITLSFDGPQHDDILATNRHYGDRYESDDSPANAAALGSFISLTESNLSVDDNSDVDVYSLTVGAGAELDVTLNPVGSTYLSGPQNTTYPYACTTGSSFNSLIVQDLGVRVLSTNGSTVLAAADANGVGQSETLHGVTLSAGAGTYYVEVTGDTADSAQLYQLSLSIADPNHVFTDGFESDSTGAWSATVP